MMRFQEDNLQVALTKVIDTWLSTTIDANEQSIEWPVLGPDASAAMATAALAVLRGIVDSQKHMVTIGLLEDEE